MSKHLAPYTTENASSDDAKNEKISTARNASQSAHVWGIPTGAHACESCEKEHRLLGRAADDAKRILEPARIFFAFSLQIFLSREGGRQEGMGNGVFPEARTGRTGLVQQEVRSLAARWESVSRPRKTTQGADFAAGRFGLVTRAKFPLLRPRKPRASVA